MRADTRRGGSGPPSHPSTPVWRLWSPRYRGPCAPVGWGGALREALFPPWASPPPGSPLEEAVCTSCLVQQRSPQSSRSGCTSCSRPAPDRQARVPTQPQLSPAPCEDGSPQSQGLSCGMQVLPLNPLHGCANEGHRGWAAPPPPKPQPRSGSVSPDLVHPSPRPAAATSGPERPARRPAAGGTVGSQDGAENHGHCPQATCQRRRTRRVPPCTIEARTLQAGTVPFPFHRRKLRLGKSVTGPRLQG